MSTTELDNAKSFIYKAFVKFDNAKTPIYTLSDNSKKLILQQLENTPVRNYPDSELEAFHFIRSIMS